jgi:predicted nucleic acid-binding protein
MPNAVALELSEGRQKGYDVPDPNAYDWIQLVDPVSLPSEWLAIDLGAGELAAMALALENRSRVVLLDDALARHIAQAAGLEVWGTLKICSKQNRKGSPNRLHRLSLSFKPPGCGFQITFGSAC